MMSKLEKLCIKWLNDNYGDLERYETKKYSDYIFHMKDGNCILEYNRKNGYVYVNYGEIWSFFERMFGMNYQQIQDLTKVWVEEQYKKEITTNISYFLGQIFAVEEQYKKEITTNGGESLRSLIKVEELYKKDVTTTHKLMYINQTPLVEEYYKKRVTTSDGRNYFTSKVEEHYKKDVTTAISRNHNFRHPVEEHYKKGVTLTAPNPTSIQVEENYKIK